MDLKKAKQYWLEAAVKDWKACRDLFKNRDYPQCLFWGHLVIEKLIKAKILSDTGKQAPFSHDLVYLASKCNLQLTDEIRDQFNEINSFNQFGRYDNELIEFAKKCTPAYTKKYFSIIKKLYLWLLREVRK